MRSWQGSEGGGGNYSRGGAGMGLRGEGGNKVREQLAGV